MLNESELKDGPLETWPDYESSVVSVEITKKCPNCRGRGSIRFGRGLLRTTEGCPDCAGTGRVPDPDYPMREQP